MLLVLTCADPQEAHVITNALLEHRLVACVKQLSTTSHFWWQGNKESAQEILLLMETIEEKFDAIHDQVKTLHSYDTFVLQGIPVTQTSDAVKKWLQEELND